MKNEISIEFNPTKFQLKQYSNRLGYELGIDGYIYGKMNFDYKGKKIKGFGYHKLTPDEYQQSKFGNGITQWEDDNVISVDFNKVGNKVLSKKYANLTYL